MDTPNPPATPSLGRALRILVASDPFVRLGLAVNTAIAIFLLLPAVPIELKKQASPWIALVLLALIFIVLRERRAEITDAEEKRFWGCLTLGYGWILTATILSKIPHFELLRAPLGTRGGGLTFALFYFFLVLASEYEPDRAHHPASSRLERLIAWPVAGVFVFGFLVYFILSLPLTLDAQRATAQPTLSLFLALDTYLVVRLSLLARFSDSPRWRLLYGAWALTFCCLSIDGMLRLILAEMPLGPSPWKILQRVSFLVSPWLAVVSVRLRHLPLGRQATLRGAAPYEDARLPAASSRTLVLALSFPTVHLLFHQLGLLDPAHKSQRAVVALGWMALLGLVALAQARLLDRRTAEIWGERKRFEAQLSSSENDLRLILERRRAARSLEVAEDRFERIFRACPDAVAITTERDGRVVDANPGFERATGFEREELVGRTFAEIGIGSHPEGREELLRQLDKRGGAVELEVDFRNRSGKMHIARLLLDRVTIAGERCLITIARDITERRRIELEREKQAALLDNASAAIYALDGEQRISFWNRGAERLFGQKAGEALGHPADELGPVARREPSLAIDLWSTAILDEKGRPAGRLVVASEMTSR